MRTCVDRKGENMNVKEIVKIYLEQNGYSGLCNADAQCGCELNDLMPCQGEVFECVAGYKCEDPRIEHKGQWAIFTDKNPEDEDWDEIEY